MTIIRFCSDCNNESDNTQWCSRDHVRRCFACQEARESEDAADWTWVDNNGEIAR